MPVKKADPFQKDSRKPALAPWERPQDPRKQFSKWLARVGAVYWVIYLTLVLALIYLRPEVAIGGVYLTVIITANKMIDTWAYTHNSTYEKSLRAILDKTKMELTLNAGNGKGAGTDEEISEKEDSNG